MKYKVSAVIPFYNGESYIERCIESVINQTLKEIEIILVDDGSTDNSKLIIQKYMKKNKNIKYIYQENGRQGKARNTGLKHANGEYVSFIDSDDYISLDMFENMYYKAISRNYDIVMCDILKIYDDNTKYLSAYEFLAKDNENISKQEYFLFEPGPCNKIFKREFLLKNKFSFPEKIIDEDYAVIPSLAIYNPKVCYIPKPYYNYVQTNSSTTRQDSYQARNEDILIATDILYNNSIVDKDIYNELEYVVIKHLLYYSSLYFFSFDKEECLNNINKFISKNFRGWYKNKYFKKQNLKFKILCLLFYYNKTNIIKVITKLKKVGK